MQRINFSFVRKDDIIEFIDNDKLSKKIKATG